jgi:hypothetical protein
LYAKDVVGADPEFQAMVARRSREKAEQYADEIDGCFRFYGIGQRSPEVN